MISKHSEYLGTAREIAHGIVREQAEQVYSERRWPEGAIRELQRAGLGGLSVPTEFGGLGGGDVKLMAAFGALLGFPMIVRVLLFSSFFGAIMAVVLLTWNANPAKFLKRKAVPAEEEAAVRSRDPGSELAARGETPRHTETGDAPG